MNRVSTFQQESVSAGQGGDQGDEQAEEGRKPHFRMIDTQPSRKEVMEHKRTHIPFRLWCPHCVKGRGRNDPHTSGAAKGKGFEWPLVAIDYGYLKEENTSGNGLLLLCASEA